MIPRRPLFVFGIVAMVVILALIFIFSNQGKEIFTSRSQNQTKVTTPIAVQKGEEENKSTKTEDINSKKEEQVLTADTTGDKKIDEKESKKPSQEKLSITLNKNELTQGGSYFLYRSPKNIEIKYFGILDNAGQAHIAFDACDVCYRSKKGYAIKGNYAICRNCGNRYPIQSIGTENQTGGCWPSYLPIQINGDIITIKTSDLEANDYMFS
jgi:hypothetical protein